MAKAANCAGPADGEPCNQCESCAAFNEGRAMDFVEQDAASHNSVDDIRQLRENVVLSPMSGGRKVYLLDEVHMLSTGAKNALLKTLEEPPPHIIFVLATTEAHKLDATIISRCQRFDLRRIPMAAVVERLRQICAGEGYSLDDAALEDIARGASGSLRDAINGLEQVVTYYGNAPALDQVREALGLSTDIRSGELAKLALSGDLAGGLKLIAAVRDDGADMKNFNKQVVDYLRNLLLAKSGAPEALDMAREAAEETKKLASKLDRGEIVRVLKAFAVADFRDDSQASLPLELAFVESAGGAQPVRDPTLVVPREAAPPAPRSEAPPKRAQEGTQVPPPPVAATNGDGGKTEADLQPVEASGWVPRDQTLLDRVRQACKDTDKQLSGLLNGSCEVKSEKGDTVVLGFYHTFHLERIESGPYAQRLEELFSDALGRKVAVVFEHSPRERTNVTSKGGHLVQAARELGVRPVTSGPTEGGPDGEPRREP
jgi:DNA polymerase-3 subunit gamma/tau